MNRSHRHALAVVCAFLVSVFGCSGAGDTPAPVDTRGEAPNASEAFDPTVARTPEPSKSLTLAPDWQPPAPLVEDVPRPLVRVTPTKRWGAIVEPVGPHPSDAEIRTRSGFHEPLRPVPGSSSDAETEALAVALRAESRERRRELALEQFLADHPRSRWAPGLHLNLGTLAFQRARFQDALAHWNTAWELARSGEDDVSRDVADLALAETAKMNARIGREAEVLRLIEEADRRTLSGDARVKLQAAREGAWMMHNHPELSFRCGPYALVSLAEERKSAPAATVQSFLAKTASPKTGFSIPQVHAMARELGLGLQIARRDEGAPVITPSVVHWKLGHFAALVRPLEDRFLLKDPTFGEDAVIDADTLDLEATGYFLVPAGPLPSGWSPASAEQTAHLFGKGAVASIPNKVADFDHMVGGDCQSNRGSLAMATYRFHTLSASLHIEDTPIRYTPAFGPEVYVRVNYNQFGERPSRQATSFGDFSVNWSSFVQADARIERASIGLGNGGSVTFPPLIIPGTNPTNPQRGEQLIATGGLGAEKYKVVYPNGREEHYEQRVGPPPGGTEPPRVYLSRVRDPQGNEVDVEYDTTYPTRITRIVDATGLATVFRYAYPGEPYLVTAVEDPYGRIATFSYVSVAGKLRLQSTRDPVGIVSSFAYDATGQVNAMTTPYGTTSFRWSDKINGPLRFLEATDPLGQTERVEFNVTAWTGIGPGLEDPPPDGSIKATRDWYQFRNSFYWDKLLMKLAPGDYRKARLYHWLHLDDSLAAGILESEASPLEGRVFYNYPGQTRGSHFVGSLGLPSAVGRVVMNAAGTNQTQVRRFEYNGYANLTKAVDPLGRETTLEYANGIDVVAVRQKTGPTTNATLATLAYAPGTPPHVPSSVTDGAGQTTTYGYNARGQVTTVLNAKNELVTFTYEANTASAAFGRLLTVTGDVPGGNRTFTYDGLGRVRTTRDSEGHVLTFGYDALDRLRTVTYPDRSFEQLEYADHSLVAARDRAGRWVRHQSNGLRERVRTRDAAGRTTQFQWCRCGELQRFVDANGKATEWVRDEGSRTTRRIQADGSSESYAYDLAGRLAKVTDAQNRTVTLSYGMDDRLATVDYSDPSTPDVTYAYDPWFPRLASRTDGSGTTTYGYHAYGPGSFGAGQVHLENGPLTSDTQKHTYDELGRLKKLEIVSDGATVVASYAEEYAYDARGRVTGVTNNLGTSSLEYVGQSSRPRVVTHGNGMQTSYGYEAASGDFVLKQAKHETSGPTRTVLSQFDYGYASDRSITTWTVNQGSASSTWSFGYDEARQLTSATRRLAGTVQEAWRYGYDPAGNRVEVGRDQGVPEKFGTNDLNQLVTAGDVGPTTFSGFTDEPATVKVNGQAARVESTDGGAPYRFEAQVKLDAGANAVVVEAKDGRNNTSTKTYDVTTTGENKRLEYDANGNLRFEKAPNGAILREYRWDQQNRLVRTVMGARESAYEYDGASRRVGIRELLNGAETKNERFVWCGSRICQKRVSNGTTVLRNYFGGGFTEGATKYFTTRDHLGSVREVVGADGKVVASRLSYDPWGKVTETGAKSDFTYTGHYADRATGLNLAWRRGYDPNLGRWLSMDPVGLDGGPNVYGYVNNDPVNAFDPDGEDAIYINYDWYPVNTGYKDVHLPLGHAGVVAVDPKTGVTSYYEYGRYDAAKLGVVLHQTPIPNLVMGKDRKPTEASLKELYDYLSKHYGKNSQVSAKYYNDADHKKVISFAERRMKDPHRKPYSLLTNNCKTFAQEAIDQAR